MKKKIIIFSSIGIIAFLLIIVLFIYKDSFNNKKEMYVDKLEHFTYSVPSNFYAALSDDNGSTWYKDRYIPYCAVKVVYQGSYIYDTYNLDSAYDPKNIIIKRLDGFGGNLKYSYSDIKEMMIDGHKWYYIDNATEKNHLVQIYITVIETNKEEKYMTYYLIDMSDDNTDHTNCVNSLNYILNSIKFKI